MNATMSPFAKMLMKSAEASRASRTSLPSQTPKPAGRAAKCASGGGGVDRRSRKVHRPANFSDNEAGIAAALASYKIPETPAAPTGSLARRIISTAAAARGERVAPWFERPKDAPRVRASASAIIAAGKKRRGEIA